MQVTTQGDNTVFIFTKEEQKYLMDHHLWYLILSKLTYKETVRIEDNEG